MVAFIDQHSDQYGVEPICKELPIAPSTYHRYKTLERHPEQRSARAKSDEQLIIAIQRVWEESHRNYGARKVWKQLKRESIPVARCTVERLMRKRGIEGVKRGRRCITTIPSEVAHKPLDLVNRAFSADYPNQLWVADITYVATWSGFVYVAFVIDVFSRYIVGKVAEKISEGQQEYYVDGISGATMTSKGVTEMVDKWLKVYEPFFQKVRQTKNF